MSYIHEIRIQFYCDDDGDITANVTSRKGLSDNIPPYETLHDSHFLDDALKVLRRESSKVRRSFRNDATKQK